MPGEIHIPGIKWLAIRPHHTRAQVESNGFEISAQETIRNSGDCCGDAGHKLTSGSAIDERCVQAILDHIRKGLA